MTQEVRGEMPFFETGPISRVLTRLILGPWRFLWCFAAGASVVGAAVIGKLIVESGETSSQWSLPLGFFISVVLVLAAFWGSRRVVRGVSRRNWAARGAPSRMNILWRIGDEGFRMENETKTVIVPWTYINQLSLEGRHWLVVSAGSGYFLSRKVFTSPSEEHTFIAGLFERLSSAARARSQNAQTWLASQPSV